MQRYNFAILIGGKNKYMLVQFNYESERDTFVSHSNFMPITEKQARKYVPAKIFHLCVGRTRVVFDNDGKIVGKVESLYKCVSQQKPYRPEDDARMLAPKARRKNIINGTTAHSYKQ